MHQKGLYSSINSEDEIGALATELLRKGSVGTFDCYCIGCQRETPFIVSEMPTTHAGGGLRGGNGLIGAVNVHAVRAVCQRDLTGYTYVFQKIGKELVKIGQAPAMAAISFGELKGIDRGLEPFDRMELGKALGLYAHDSPLGAFVYLRRVFERMIARAHERQAERDGAIAGFDSLRMDEKIAALKSELPERVVKNSAVFSVLSLGIHELSDEQCQTIFPVVKAVIFQMLEQEEHKRKQKLTEEQTDAALNALLASNLRSSTDIGDNAKAK